MVGGGVVGLAIALVLAQAGRAVVLLETGSRCGAETSARNNQVVHAGFLYPPGSLKAALCRPGRDALLAYAAARGVPHRLAPKPMPCWTMPKTPVPPSPVNPALCRAPQVRHTG